MTTLDTPEIQPGPTMGRARCPRRAQRRQRIQRLLPGALCLAVGLAAGGWIQHNLDRQSLINPAILEAAVRGTIDRTIAVYQRHADQELTSEAQRRLSLDLHQAGGFGPLTYSHRSSWLAGLIGPDSELGDAAKVAARNSTGS